VLTLLGIVALCAIDYAPGLLGVLTTNPPLLILGLALTGIGLGILMEAIW
jgi:hypothetical protein